MEGCISNQIIKHSSWPPKLCKKLLKCLIGGQGEKPLRSWMPVTSALAPCSPVPAWCPLGCHRDAGAVRLVRCPGVGSSLGAGAGCALHEQALGSRRRRKEGQAERWREDCGSRVWPWCLLSIPVVLRHCPPAPGLGGTHRAKSTAGGCSSLCSWVFCSRVLDCKPPAPEAPLVPAPQTPARTPGPCCCFSCISMCPAAGPGNRACGHVV